MIRADGEIQATDGCRKLVFWLLCIGVFVHIGGTVILASVPPISRDALVHHLAIPKMYLARGAIYEIPSMNFSYFPMNVDLLYLLPLYFKHDFAAKYIHFMFALLTAGLIYRYLKNTLDEAYGLIGVLFFLTLPIIVKLSVTAYVDLGLVFFTWASLYYLIKWKDCDFKTRYLIYSGIGCGLALGTKYNGLILLPIMGAMVPIVYSFKNNRDLPKEKFRQRYANSLRGLRWGVVFVLLALTTFSPWMIRNAIWTNNPIYPLFNNIFNPPEKLDDNPGPKEKKPVRNAFWTRRHIYNESFAETLLIPIRAFFQGQDNNPKYFDGKLNPFLLLLPLLAFWPGKAKRLASLTSHKAIFSGFAVLFILFVLFRADFRIRYMAPAIPPLIVLSVFGVNNLVKTLASQTGPAKQPIGWIVIVALLLAAFLYNGSYIYSQFNYIRPFDYLTHQVDRDAYVSRYRREHEVVVHANQILPKDSRVLCLATGKRTYYLDRSVHLAENFFNRKNGRFDAEVLLKKMERYGTTHVILDKKYVVNWMKSLNTEEKTVFLNFFMKHTKLLYEKNDVVLLEFLKTDNVVD